MPRHHDLEQEDFDPEPGGTDEEPGANAEGKQDDTVDATKES